MGAGSRLLRCDVTWIQLMPRLIQGLPQGCFWGFLLDELINLYHIPANLGYASLPCASERVRACPDETLPYT
jgi:hypothetical protein